MKKTLRPGTPEFEFVGELEDIAETKYKANIHGVGEAWEDVVFAEYQAAGSPKPVKKWITERIKNEFKSMDKPPAWVDFETSVWPFHKGKPMVFIAQIPLKESKDTEAQLIEGVAYIFGLRDKGERGEDIMVYHGQTLMKWR